jgi:hypothetical protein
MGIPQHEPDMQGPDMPGPDLYQRDFHAWALDQAIRLRILSGQRSNIPLDMDHLAEEIEDIGNNELDVVEGNLDQVAAHLLKLEWSEQAGPRAHWKTEIRAMRRAAHRKIKRSPTLRLKIDVADVNETGRDLALLALRLKPGDIPADHAYTLDQLLDARWFPANRHGLTDEE